MTDGREFRLTSQQRNRLPKAINPHRLEQLLKCLPPDARDFVLNGVISTSAGISGFQITGDEELRKLLEGIWEEPREPSGDWAAVGPPEPSPVTLALVTLFEPEDALALIWRRTEAEPKELILLRESIASSQVLAVALAELARMRFRDLLEGAERGSDQRRPISRDYCSSDFGDPLRDLGEPFRSIALAQEADLKAEVSALMVSERQEINGLGSVRCKTMYV